MSNRNEWIENRAADGYDFTALVRAVARLNVEATVDGLLVDASALHKDSNYPTHHLLMPEDDGMWAHSEVGESGPLVEMLLTIALSAVEKGGGQR